MEDRDVVKLLSVARAAVGVIWLLAPHKLIKAWTGEDATAVSARVVFSRTLESVSTAHADRAQLRPRLVQEIKPRQVGTQRLQRRRGCLGVARRRDRRVSRLRGADARRERQAELVKCLT
jgi:hypothetical protein